MTRAIICGGRDFRSAIWMYAVLDAMHAKRPFSLIIEGGQRSYETERGKRVCVGGADYWASMWAMSRRIEVARVEARWAELGDKAGPIRNAEMLKQWRPDLVVAFPGGVGTADMVRKARAAGVETIEVKP